MNHVLITGANRGIGLELCRQYAASGAQVTAVCRRSSAELDALAVRVLTGIDVTQDSAVAALREQLGNDSIDILLCNAGVLHRDSLDAMDFAAIRDQFEVNTLGPLRVIAALYERIPEGGRIGIVSSRMGSIADNTSGGYYGYRISKAGVNTAGVSLAKDLQDRGVAVCLLHPGYVATDMTDRKGIPVTDAAAGLIARLDALTMATTGTFWHANGKELPW